MLWSTKVRPPPTPRVSAHNARRPFPSPQSLPIFMSLYRHCHLRPSNQPASSVKVTPAFAKTGTCIPPQDASVSYQPINAQRTSLDPSTLPPYILQVEKLHIFPLKHVYFRHNPIFTDIRYRSKLMDCLPHLETIDSIPVRR